MVVDASALAAVIFNEPEADDIAALIDGHNLSAPPLLQLELINIAMKKARRAPDLADDVWAQVERARSLPIEWHEAPLELVIDGVRRHGLTAYDAAYMAVAIARNEPLATLDRLLKSAASDAGVRVIP